MLQTPVKLTFEEYLIYEDKTDNRYELVRGTLFLMNPPTVRHLLIAKLIERVLDAEINRLKLNLVALREAGVQTELDSARIPDVCVVTREQIANLLNQSAVFRTPARLVVEVVSPSSWQLDYEQKSSEYANKGIPEYWIVDPQNNKVLILWLVDGKYQTTEFRGSDNLISRTFPEINLTASDILTPIIF